MAIEAILLKVLHGLLAKRRVQWLGLSENRRGKLQAQGEQEEASIRGKRHGSSV
jgi:hypothetical protein